MPTTASVAASLLPGEVDRHRMNLLMISIPVGMLPPYHQSLIRSAGMLGFGALEEAVSKGHTMLCVEVNPDSSHMGPFEDIAHSNHVPLSTHQRSLADFPDIQKLHEALNTCMGMLSLKARFLHPETVSPGFLHGLTQLTNVEVSLPSALTVKNGFLSVCIALRTLRVYLPVATHLEDAFILNCPQLKTLEIDLPEVVSIGNNFLANNYKLETLVISLPKLVEIGDAAFSSCPSITSLQLHLPNLTKMGRYFMKKTSALSTLDLQMPSIENIEWEFLGMSGVTSLSLNLPHLEKIGHRFMFDCLRLKSILINAPSMRSVVKDPFQGSLSVTNMSLIIGSSRQVIRGNRIYHVFNLQNLSGLEELNVTLLEERDKVNFSEFKTSAKLSTLRLFAPEAVTLDPAFFINNKNLKVFELDAPKLQYFSHNFLHQCVKLERVMIEAISAQTISSGFLWKCSSLLTATIRVPAVTTIASHFLRECPLLTLLDVAHMPSLVSIGGGFMQDCKSLTALDLDPFLCSAMAASAKSIKIEGCRSLTTIRCSDVAARALVDVTLGKESVKDGIEFLTSKTTK